jgi:hypothetical protein
MSFTDRIKASLNESLMIAGIAGVGSVVGANSLVTSTIAKIPGISSLSGSVQQGVLLFGVVFTADMIYNLFLA